MTVIIAVSYYGGTYRARAVGLNLRATCTSGMEAAVKVCAVKVERLLGGTVTAPRRIGGTDAWRVTIRTPNAPAQGREAYPAAGCSVSESKGEMT